MNSAGYQEDADSGLKLLGNRYYDASLGRFLSRDPIKDGSNWYSYCGGNPVSNADPGGLDYLVTIVSAAAGENAGLGLGHSWIFITDLETGNCWSVGNWNGSDHFVNIEYDPMTGRMIYKYSTFRTRRVKTLPKLLSDPDKYNPNYSAIGWNCADFAIQAWYDATGEVIGDGIWGLDTPSSLVKDIIEENVKHPAKRFDPNMRPPVPGLPRGGSSGSSDSSNTHGSSGSLGLGSG